MNWRAFPLLLLCLVGAYAAGGWSAVVAGTLCVALYVGWIIRSA